MRGSWAVGAVLAALGIACTSTGTAPGGVTVSPPPPDATPVPSPTPSATASPGPDGPLQTGGASISITGDLTAQVSLPTLVQPDAWAPPPGSMDLRWSEPGGQALQLSGASFTSLASTSEDRVLELLVNGPTGPVEFRSAAGECTVTITPALPDQVGGLFRCTGLSDAGGAFTVGASGAFSASG